MSQIPDETFNAPEPAESATVPPAPTEPPSSTTEEPMSENEQSLLHKIAEVGEDTVKRLKEIFSEVDREELRKSVNREKIQRTVASTLDALNAKAQAFLAPKTEASDDANDDAAPTDLSTSPDSPGPVGTEAVQHDDEPRHSAENPPENETRSFT